MSKTELVEFVAADAGMSKAEAGRALDSVLKGIQAGLKKEGINPLTKESIKIPAKTVASFKAGSKLKDALN